MADDKEENNDISLEQKLNGAIKERISLLERQNEKIRDANNLSRKFNELAREKSASEKVDNLKESLDALLESQEEGNKSLSDMFDKVYKKTRMNSKQVGISVGFCRASCSSRLAWGFQCLECSCLILLAALKMLFLQWEA